MTPFALKIAKRALSNRACSELGMSVFYDNIFQAAMFECTAIGGISKEMMSGSAPEARTQMAGAYLFTPSPVTFIELDAGLAWGKGKSDRICFLLIDGDNSIECHAATLGYGPSGSISFSKTPGSGCDFVVHPLRNDWRLEEALRLSAFTVLSLLAFINSPKIISRNERAPNARIVRELRESGRQYDRKWNEIALKVTDDGSHGHGEARSYCGKKALHFCRSFLRFKRGKLEIVRAHWRGDAAVGVRNSFYTVRP